MDGLQAPHLVVINTCSKPTSQPGRQPASQPQSLSTKAQDTVRLLLSVTAPALVSLHSQPSKTEHQQQQPHALSATGCYVVRRPRTLLQA